jgi:hypothetical protein
MIVRFVSAYIDSAGACSFTIEKEGTAASSTALVPAPVNPVNSSAAISTGWYSSNVGTGTVITRASIAAGGSVIVDLSRVYLQGNGTSKNLSLRTASCSGVVNIVITYTESGS